MTPFIKRENDVLKSNPGIVLVFAIQILCISLKIPLFSFSCYCKLGVQRHQQVYNFEKSCTVIHQHHQISNRGSYRFLRAEIYQI